MAKRRFFHYLLNQLGLYMYHPRPHRQRLAFRMENWLQQELMFRHRLLASNYQNQQFRLRLR